MKNVYNMFNGREMRQLSEGYERAPQMTRVVCADGFTASVQASESHYCSPRDNNNSYVAVEIGYPSENPVEWDKWAADDGIYAYVPVDEVQEVLDKHGGIVSGGEPLCF